MKYLLMILFCSIVIQSQTCDCLGYLKHSSDSRIPHSHKDDPKNANCFGFAVSKAISPMIGKFDKNDIQTICEVDSIVYERSFFISYSEFESLWQQANSDDNIFNCVDFQGSSHSTGNILVWYNGSPSTTSPNHAAIITGHVNGGIKIKEMDLRDKTGHINEFVIKEATGWHPDDGVPDKILKRNFVAKGYKIKIKSDFPGCEFQVAKPNFDNSVNILRTYYTNSNKIKELETYRGDFTFTANDTDQYSGGRKYEYSEWLNESDIMMVASPLISADYTIKDNLKGFGTYKLKYKKNFNVQVYSDYNLYLDDNAYTSGTIEYKAEGDNLKIEAQSQKIEDDVVFNFVKWSNNSTANPYYLTVNSDLNLTAIYEGTPQTHNMNIHCTSGYMEPITLEWNEHPHPDVDKYYIYRKYTHNGSTTKIATLARGTTSYTDPQFTRTSSDMGDQLWYYIQVRYEPDDSYSDMYESDFTWGTIFLKETDENGLPTEYSLTNYPNPFNPSTIIRYGLKEKGEVTIKVYNALGKEVKTFNEGIKERGYYHIRFNASHLASGIYYYRIMTNNFVDTKKMILLR